MRLVRSVAPLLVACALSSSMHVGCKRKTADAVEAASPPKVTDASTDLLFTWIDEKGEFHVETTAGAVPEAARDLVRVRDPAREMPPERAFVVDLRTKAPDGTYAVREISRAEFEDVAVERRKAHGAVLAARPAAAASGSAGTSGGSLTDPAASPVVIIYGASWCGPCHQAAAYLKQHNIPFVEKDIEKDGSAEREMHAKLAKAGRHGGSIPVLDVRGKIVVGFSPAAVEAALGTTL